MPHSGQEIERHKSGVYRIQARYQAKQTRSFGTFSQEGDLVCIKHTGERGRINATDGGVVSVLMDKTNVSRIFSAAIDEDASIELVTPEGNI